MITIFRASRELMDEVKNIINSNYGLYEGIVDEIDLPEHQVDDEWVERNFNIREFYVLRADGEYAGMASWQLIDENSSYIGYFYIRNDLIRKGYGSNLMQFMELRNKKDSIENLLLFANKKADWALNFYQKHRFEIILKDKKDILEYKNNVFQSFFEQNSYLLKKVIKID